MLIVLIYFLTLIGM